MDAEAIANLLNGKRSGRGWLCNCPAHNDKSPSLSVTDTDDGKTLIRCFAGCSAEAVVSSMGLQMKDLFPPSEFTPQQRRTYRQKASRAQLLKTIYHEMLVLIQVIENRVTDSKLNRDAKFKGVRPEFKPMPAEFWDREQLAVSRIKQLLGQIYGA